MVKNFRYVSLLVILLLVLAGSAMADQSARSQYVNKMTSKNMTGAEEFNGAVAFGAGTSHAVSASRGNVIGQVGNTWYEYQHNGSMGRMVSYQPGTEYVHFVWMRWPTAGGARHVRYNAYNYATGGPGAWAWGSGATGGKDVSGTNGGYTTVDVTPTGDAVAAWHEGPVSTNYSSYASKDYNTPLGFFDDYTANPAPPPPNCQAIITQPPTTEGPYIWPVVDFDSYEGKEITHIAAIESPPGDDPASPQSIIYYRAVDGVWDNHCGGYGAPCGLYIDIVYNIAPIVRSNDNNDEVALVWLKPMYMDNDPNDPCGWTQWQNDIVYIESQDAGCTWGGENNVTDYSQGGTLTPDQMVHQAYTDVSALYTEDNCLHIVWSTPLRDLQGDNPCAPLYATRVWHWDDCNDCISLVYDATRPRFFCPTGAFMMSTGKVNISECVVGGGTRLYTMFSRMGAHTSADGDTCADCSIGAPDNEFGNYANSDIFITGSSDGGLTWGPSPDLPLYETHPGDGTQVTQGSAVNTTNTNTNDCQPGDCLSEHWGTVAKYNVDTLHIMFIEDHDAGAGIRDDPQEGQLTDNPVVYMQEYCFAIAEVCDFAVTPQSGAITIAPSGGTDCTVPTSTTFEITISNSGNQPVNYTASATDGDLVTNIAPTSGSIGVGCVAPTVVTVTVGPITDEGRYVDTVTISGNCDKADIHVIFDIYVKCFPPEYAILSTACWSVGVWNTARAGATDEVEGQMFWFPNLIPPDGAAFMYDDGWIITFADDDAQTYTSIFDGGDAGLTIVPDGPLFVEARGDHDYATAPCATSDYEFGPPPNEPAVRCSVEYFVPYLPNTCVLIERLEVWNNADTTIRIKVGEAIDWDIPASEDAAGENDNTCGSDQVAQIVWQVGATVPPNTNYYGTVQFCTDIFGAIVVDNPTYVYPHNGYPPDTLGLFLDTLTAFHANCPEPDDYSSIYAVDRIVTLAPGASKVYCKVKASSYEGIGPLYDFLLAGRQWIAARNHATGDPLVDIDCPGECCCCIKVGDADGSGGLDIDDVVYLITHIFSGGPAPVPCAQSSGDADSSYGVDIDDVVYLINHIFLGGPPPGDCDTWLAGCAY